MKALFFKEHGGPDRLQFGELNEPALSPGTVIVRVKACALNHLDLWVLRGWPNLKLAMPHIGGADIAGEIAAIGPGVSNWKVGQRVAITPGFIPSGVTDEFTSRGEDSLSPKYKVFGESLPGGFAELIAVPAHTLMSFPDSLSFAHAAAPLLVGTTAWRMLKHRAKVQSGETVVFVGAGGGVNSFSIMLAKDLGARVIALTSTRDKMQKASQLGADEVLNYREMPKWSEEIRRMTNRRGADVIVDNVGASSITQSLHAAARGGRIVTVGNTSGFNIVIDNRLIFGKQLSLLGSTMGNADDARQAAGYAWSKKLDVLINRELPLAEGQRGYELLEKGSQFGKIVLLP